MTHKSVPSYHAKMGPEENAAALNTVVVPLVSLPRYLAYRGLTLEDMPSEAGGLLMGCMDPGAMQRVVFALAGLARHLTCVSRALICSVPRSGVSSHPLVKPPRMRGGSSHYFLFHLLRDAAVRGESWGKTFTAGAMDAFNRLHEDYVATRKLILPDCVLLLILYSWSKLVEDARDPSSIRFTQVHDEAQLPAPPLTANSSQLAADLQSNVAASLLNLQVPPLAAALGPAVRYDVRITPQLLFDTAAVAFERGYRTLPEKATGKQGPRRIEANGKIHGQGDGMWLGFNAASKAIQSLMHGPGAAVLAPPLGGVGAAAGGGGAAAAAAPPHAPKTTPLVHVRRSFPAPERCGPLAPRRG